MLLISNTTWNVDVAHTLTDCQIIDTAIKTANHDQCICIQLICLIHRVYTNWRC